MTEIQQTITTEVTKDDMKTAVRKCHRALYSKDGKRLLKYENGNSRRYSIKKGTEVICKNAFSYSWKLTKIIIPKSIKEIEDEAFDPRNELTEFKVSKKNTYFCAKDGVLFSKEMDILIKYPTYISRPSYDIPISAVKIGNHAFRGCEELNKSNIPSNIIEIGDYAFTWCINLTEVTIPNSVVEIGRGAFEYCESLTEIIIPNSITKISDNVFYGCTKLAKVTIPDSVTEIGDSAFVECSNLGEITIPESVTIIGKEAFDGCSNLTEINIPKNVSRIGNSAFKGCNHLKIAVAEDNECFCTKDGVLFSKKMDILIWCPLNFPHSIYNIPNCVTKIGDSAFNECENLVGIIIPDSVIEIGDNAFSFCWNLNKITLPDSVVKIGNKAFHECYHLTAINIPNTVTEIGDGAFLDCENLTITIAEDNEYFCVRDKILFSKEMDTLIRFPAYYHNRFDVVSYKVPDNVTKIGNYAFYGCHLLVKITIPNSVNKIGDKALYSRSIGEIISLNPKPPICGDDVFLYEIYDCPPNKLYVPKGSKEAYSIAKGWKGFKEIEEI